MKTFTIRGTYNDQKWFVINAENQILGRMSSRIAAMLRGKHKPVFSPHLDVGDYIIVINADKIRVTGNKEDKKVYYRHTGYVGHLKTVTLKQMRAKKPEFIIHNAVRKMLPKNSLGRKMLKKLKIYAGASHPHTAQKPEVLEFKT